ncbi:HmuY family protein [uncultured Bacteroides sp.]|jgi:major membrane immunogen (membrane-anchored lipoprotein)|uniref:HmuY family protein n=1 Tax=uncultured Bacteroides sp. TaxID=162156 RepID=UPI0025F26D0A|nr:HmuY family protein [uncultured Bacteroides sp.]
MKMFKLGSISAMLILLSVTGVACSNDDDEKKVNDPKTQTLTVDATKYNQWVYVNLKDGKTQTVTMDGKDDESKVTIDWQIALHRYTEVKTNGGSVVQTAETSMDKVTEAPAGGYTADSDGQRILVKFSMPPTDDCFVTTHCNTVMKWTEGSAMDGTLATTNKVFVLKCKDGSVAKLQFTDYANSDNVKGHVTLQYQYPFN